MRVPSDDPVPPPRPAGSSLVPLIPSVPAAPVHPDDQPTFIGPAPRPAPSPHVVVHPGTRLGQYEVTGAVGAGGMATVLKARDTELGRDVALKILPPEAARDPDAVARFKLEARSAAKLDHEHVARVFSCGEDRGLHFIAFEFVEGVTLRDEIERLGTVPAADCVRYMGHLAAGLRHAADRGVVHRDVKPSNIIITPDGRAKLIDMGLARQIDLQANGGVTQSGVTLGTFDYISPEQALDPRRADVRSDLYSLGCAFYHALTGRPPVPEGTAARKLQAHQHEPPLDPRDLNPAVPDAVAVVLSKLMAKDPADRYPTPQALQADLTDIERRWRDAADTSTAVAALPRSVDLPRVPLGLLAGLAALVAAAAIVYGSLGGPSAPAPPAWPDFAAAATKPSLVDGPPNPPGPRPQPAAGVPLETAGDLVRAFDAASVSVRLVPGHTYDLSATAGALFTGKDLTVECDPTNPATIRLAATPPKKGGGLREGTLTVERAESVRFHGIVFELVEPPSDDTDSRAAPVGLLVTDAAKVEFAECRVELAAAARSAFGCGVRLVRTDRAPVAALDVRHCLFDLRRWAAIELGEGLTATVRETGFATADAAIRYTEDAEPPDLPVALTLRHCTFLLENRAAAVDVRKGAGGTVNGGYCVFAAPPADPTAMMMNPEAAERKPAVLRVAEGADPVAYAAEPDMPNAYYRVDVPPGAGDKDADLRQSPWADKAPRDRLASAEPWRAFALNPSAPGVRVAGAKDVFLPGVKRLPLERRKTGVYDTWPPAGGDVDAPPPGFKVWWPDPPADKRDLLPAAGVYLGLAEALAAAKRDDVLLIRGTGPIEIPALPPLNRPDLRLTIRPEGDAPLVLVPAEATRADASLFRLEDGELTLERLHFRLKPTEAEAADLRSLAVVSLAGGRRCEFHQCAFTFDAQRTERLAAVAVVDVAGQMRKPDATRRPLVRFESCFLRGKGRAVYAANAIPCDVALGNTVCALLAPAVEFDAPARPPASGAAAAVTLTRVTALLAEPFFELRMASSTDGKPGAAVPLEVRADGCLFAPALPLKPPLARVTNADPATADRAFGWQPAGPNAFANWPAAAALFEVAGDDGADGKRLDAAGWVAFAREGPEALLPVKWAKPLGKPPSPRDLEPADPKDDRGAKRGTAPAPLDD